LHARGKTDVTHTSGTPYRYTTVCVFHKVFVYR